MRTSRRLLVALVLLSLVVLILPPSIASAGSIIYVDADATGGNNGSSWGDAFNDLQDALAIASAGDQIWVAEGTYKPGTGQHDTFQLISGVAIYGGFSGAETSLDQRDWVTHVTVLSGDINTPGDMSDNIYHVVNGSGSDGTAIMDGFTITAGNAEVGDANGGGMYNYYSSPVVTNCTFSGNKAEHGGGMWTATDSNSVVTNCTFSGNSAGYFGGGGWATL